MKIGRLGTGKVIDTDIPEVSESDLMDRVRRWKSIRSVLDALTTEERANVVDYLIQAEIDKCNRVKSRAGRLSEALDRSGESEWMLSTMRDIEAIPGAYRDRLSHVRHAITRLDMLRMSAAIRLRNVRTTRKLVARRLSWLIQKKSEKTR